MSEHEKNAAIIMQMKLPSLSYGGKRKETAWPAVEKYPSGGKFRHLQLKLPTHHGVGLPSK